MIEGLLTLGFNLTWECVIFPDCFSMKPNDLAMVVGGGPP